MKDNIQIVTEYTEFCLSQMSTEDLQQFFYDRFFDECINQDPIELMDDIEEYAPEIMEVAWTN